MEITKDKKNKTVTLRVHGSLPYDLHETMSYAQAEQLALELLKTCHSEALRVQ